MFEHPKLRAVICNSKMVREEIKAAFRVAPEKLHVIYNGVDLEHFHPRHRAALRAQARSALGCLPRDTVFLFVGSGFARKGLEAAIDALAAAADDSFRLVVAGQDRDERRYAEQASRRGVRHRVQLLGGREDVRPLYAAADCFILPTRYDPFPNTALEALAMGLPIIVSSRSGAAEVVREGENGWLCAPDDAPALAGLMARAAAAAGDGAMGQNARESAEGFSIEAMAEKLAQLYATL